MCKLGTGSTSGTGTGGARSQHTVASTRQQRRWRARLGRLGGLRTEAEQRRALSAPSSLGPGAAAAPSHGGTEGPARLPMPRQMQPARRAGAAAGPLLSRPGGARLLLDARSRADCARASGCAAAATLPRQRGRCAPHGAAGACHVAGARSGCERLARRRAAGPMCRPLGDARRRATTKRSSVSSSSTCWGRRMWGGGARGQGMGAAPCMEGLRHAGTHRAVWGARGRARLAPPRPLPLPLPLPLPFSLSARLPKERTEGADPRRAVAPVLFEQSHAAIMPPSPELLHSRPALSATPIPRHHPRPPAAHLPVEVSADGCEQLALAVVAAATATARQLEERVVLLERRRLLFGGGGRSSVLRAGAKQIC
jgi:hypothetical protein